MNTTQYGCSVQTFFFINLRVLPGRREGSTFELCYVYRCRFEFLIDVTPCVSWLVFDVRGADPHMDAFCLFLWVGSTEYVHGFVLP